MTDKHLIGLGILLVIGFIFAFSTVYHYAGASWFGF